VESLSCGSAGNCTAGGQYYDDNNDGQAYLVNETNGTWGTAEEVPGFASLNVGAVGYLMSVSCRSTGNCSAGGRYVDAAGHTQPFVINETKGAWGRAEEIPGFTSG